MINFIKSIFARLFLCQEWTGFAFLSYFECSLLSWRAGQSEMRDLLSNCPCHSIIKQKFAVSGVEITSRKIFLESSYEIIFAGLATSLIHHPFTVNPSRQALRTSPFRMNP
jgi:hypothetical protein